MRCAAGILKGMASAAIKSSVKYHYDDVFLLKAVYKKVKNPLKWLLCRAKILTSSIMSRKSIFPRQTVAASDGLIVFWCWILLLPPGFPPMAPG